MTRTARLLALSLVLAITALAAASSAQAAATAITQGSLKWGVRESFRNYVVGGIAKGSISVSGGATQASGNGVFTFPLKSGSYDSDSGATLASFDGSVRFLGHGGELDLTMSNLRIELLDAGSFIVADVSTTSFPSTGPPQSYEDVPLVQLDLTAKTPTQSTMWTALPATLTSIGAPLFGGFYQPGAVFDPATLDYSGPGGKPVSEGFTKPGTAAFDDVVQRGKVYGYPSGMVRDEKRNLLHVVGEDGVRAFDLDTLEPRGEAVFDTSDLFSVSQSSVAFDPDTGTVFVWRFGPDDDGDDDPFEDEDSDGVPTDPGNIRALTWSDGGYSDRKLDFPGAAVMQFDTEEKLLYLISSEGFGVGSGSDPAVRVAEQNAGTWSVGTYPALDTNGRNVVALRSTVNGALVGLYGGLNGGAFTLKKSGSTLVATDVPGTTLSQPASGTSFGFALMDTGAGGAVVVGEFGFNLASSRIQRLEPTSENASGYRVTAGGSDAVPSLSTLVFGGDSGSVFAGDGTGIGLRRNSTEVGRLPASGNATVSDDGALLEYNGGTSKLTRWEQIGTSPSVGAAPGDQRVELSAAGESRAVQFTATSAGGTPTPTVKWQVREPGQGGWTDVPGATSTTLQVNATPAASGNRYRAVFENAAGKIATQPAALVVTVRPASPAANAGTPAGNVASPLPPAPAAIARRAVAATLRSKSLRVSKGRIALSIRGTGVKSRTTITVRTRARYRVGKKRKLVTVAKGTATLSASGATTVRLKLTREGRALLKKRKSITVVVRIAPRGAPVTTRTLRLRG